MQHLSPSTDMRAIGAAFADLRSRGWLARLGYACCMTCAKAELEPLSERGVPCVWTTDNDHRGKLKNGNFCDGSMMHLSVLGDVAIVADALRPYFGDRVVHLQPETEESIGCVYIDSARPAQTRPSAARSPKDDAIPLDLSANEGAS